MDQITVNAIGSNDAWRERRLPRFLPVLLGCANTGMLFGCVVACALIVPKFSELFPDFGVELDPMLRLLVSASDKLSGGTSGAVRASSALLLGCGVIWLLVALACKPAARKAALVALAVILAALSVAAPVGMGSLFLAMSRAQSALAGS